MRISADCLPCVLRQCIQAATMVTDDRELIYRVAREVAALSADYSSDTIPAHISEAAHGLTRRLVGSDDPYREAKDHYNRVALDLLPRLREIVATANDRVQMAAAVAAAGNVIDLGLDHVIDIDGALRQVLDEGFAVNDWTALHAALEGARRVLFLADNAGEIVFDRVLLEELRRAYPHLDLTCMVKAAPILNDATADDARVAGIDRICRITDTGQATVGLIVEQASADLRRELESADLIIAKGQANYESLDELDFPTLFILKAKCPAVAASLGVEVGQVALKAHHLGGPRRGRRAQPPVRLLIFDLDGVIYRGVTLLPHAAETVAWARDRGLIVRFLTNNSTVSRDEYSRRLGGFGIPTPADHVMTSAYASALYLKSRGEGGARVLVVGEGGLREEMAAAGFEVLSATNRCMLSAAGETPAPPISGARYVVVGMDRDFDYATLRAAMSAILAGAEFIASNRDTTFPVEDGLLPGGGAIVAAIEAAVGFAPQLVGKPETRMLELLLEETGCAAAEALMVGDRLDTDIKVGRAGGVRTALVLTGIASGEEAQAAPADMRPDWIVADLAELRSRLQEDLP